MKPTVAVVLCMAALVVVVWGSAELLSALIRWVMEEELGP